MGNRVPRTLDTARDLLASGRRQAVAALALYAAISVGYFGLHVLPHLGSADVGLPNWGDPTVNMWSLAWWPHALLHGLNPLVTNLVLTPNRINLAAVSPTLAPLAGIVLGPITLLFGPIVSYNVLMLASPVLDAFFAFLLCRYITRNFPASLVGGYVFGFSTYILGHMLGHPQLVLVFPIPAGVHLVLRLLNKDITQRRFIVLMSLALAALFLTASEVGATYVLLGAIALAVAFAVAPTERAQIARAIKPILAAGAVAALVSSPVIWYELHGTIKLGSGFGGKNGTDLLDFLVPTNLMRLGRKYFAALSTSYHANRSAAEASTYVGLGLALIVARYTITRWRMASTKILFAMLAVVAVAVLGSGLQIAGYLTIPLPWKLIDHWLLQDVTPARISVYMFLIVGVIAAMWLAEPRSGKWGVAKWALAGVSIAFLVPNLSSGAWRGTEPNPAFFTTHEYRSALTRGETVLVLPWGQLGYGMLWQAETGMWFKMAGGYFNAVYTPDYWADPLFPALLNNTKPDPQLLRSFLVRRHVGAVVVDPAFSSQWLGPLAELGLKPLRFGSILVYKV